MTQTPTVDPQVVALMRCPVTFSRLRLEGNELIAIDDETYRYPVHGGVAQLLDPRTA